MIPFGLLRLTSECKYLISGQSVVNTVDFERNPARLRETYYSPPPPPSKQGTHHCLKMYQKNLVSHIFPANLHQIILWIKINMKCSLHKLSKILQYLSTVYIIISDEQQVYSNLTYCFTNNSSPCPLPNQSNYLQVLLCTPNNIFDVVNSILHYVWFSPVGVPYNKQSMHSAGIINNSECTKL